MKAQRSLRITTILVVLLAVLSPLVAAAAFSRADLSGTWHLYVFFDHPAADDPGWSRGTVTLNSSGVATSGSFTDYNGTSVSITSGSLTINNLGFLSGSFSFSDGSAATFSHGKMDRGKTLLTVVGIDSEGGRFKVSAIKAGGSFATADLGGTWNYYNFIGIPGGNQAGWSRGSITFSSSGVVTGGSFTDSSGAGTDTVTGGSFTINSSGVFSGTISFLSGLGVTLSQGTMDSNKTSVAYVGVDSDTSVFAGFGIKSTGTFSTADLAGRWQYHSVWDNATSNDPGWDRGTVMVNSSGTVTGGSFFDSDGGAATVTGGSFTINSSGIYSGSLTFNNGVTSTIAQGKMAPGKTQAAYVATDTQGFVSQGTAIKIGGGVLDFDNDGKSDVGIYRDGIWSIIRSAGGANIVESLGGATDMPVPVDYDGDGQADVAIYHAANGLWSIKRSSDGVTISVPHGGPAFTPVPGDYDGDGKADIAVYSAGVWSIIRSSDGGNTVVAHGGPGWTPVAADYDGDGKTDIAVQINGAWSIIRSSDGGNTVVGHGGPTWTPVPADYDGDGKADVAVYTGGAWSIIRSSDSGNTVVGHGGPPWEPVPADYDGDGKTDIAVHLSGAWAIINSTTSSISVVGHGGGPTDVPLN